MSGTIGRSPQIDFVTALITLSTAAGSTDGGLGAAVSDLVSTTAVSPITARSLRSTDATSTPGMMRQFTSADARCGSALRAWPPSSIVATQLGLATTVQCVAPTVEYTAQRIRAEILPRFPNVDGVVSITHSYGCGVAIDAPGAAVPIRTLNHIAL